MSNGSKRYFDTEFWLGDYVLDLPPYEKLLYVYLINYPSSNIAGVIDYQPRRYAFETGIPEESVRQIVNRFVTDGKIAIIGSKLAILKWGKHQTESPAVAEGICRILSTLSIDSLRTLRDCGYILPKSLSWKTVESASTSLEQVKNEDSQGTVKGQSVEGITPYLTLPTLPYSTLPYGEPGEGEGVNNLGEEPDPWYDSAENVLGLSEYEVRALERPEFKDIYLDDEYKFLCSEVKRGVIGPIKHPAKFLETRLLKRSLAKSKKL